MLSTNTIIVVVVITCFVILGLGIFIYRQKKNEGFSIYDLANTETGDMDNIEGYHKSDNSDFLMKALTPGGGLILQNGSLSWATFNTSYIQLPTIYPLNNNITLFDGCGYKTSGIPSYPLSSFISTTIDNNGMSSITIYDLSGVEFKNVPVNGRPLVDPIQSPPGLNQLVIGYKTATDVRVYAKDSKSLYSRQPTEWSGLYSTTGDISQMSIIPTNPNFIYFIENGGLRVFDVSNNYVISKILYPEIIQFTIGSKVVGKSSAAIINVLKSSGSVFQLKVTSNMIDISGEKDISLPGVAFTTLYGSVIDDKIFAKSTDGDIYVYYDPETKFNQGWTLFPDSESISFKSISCPLYIPSITAYTVWTCISVKSSEDESESGLGDVLSRVFLSRKQDPSSNVTTFGQCNEYENGSINYTNYFVTFNVKGLLCKFDNFTLNYCEDASGTDACGTPFNGSFSLGTKTPFTLQQYFPNFSTIYTDKGSQVVNFKTVFEGVNITIPEVCGSFVPDASCSSVPAYQCLHLGPLMIMNCCKNPFFSMESLSGNIFETRDSDTCLLINHPFFDYYCMTTPFVRYNFITCASESMFATFLSFYKTIVPLQ